MPTDLARPGSDLEDDVAWSSGHQIHDGESDGASNIGSDAGAPVEVEGLTVEPLSPPFQVTIHPCRKPPSVVLWPEPGGLFHRPIQALGGSIDFAGTCCA
jgi:hypothetical protein